MELVALLTIGIRADNYNDDVWQLLAVTEDNWSDSASVFGCTVHVSM